jgi:hypothetical protein
LLFLPAAVVVMGLAAYTLLRDGSQARTAAELHACADTGCRLGVLSGVLLALAGPGLLGGDAAPVGWAMIVLGALGAAAGYVFHRCHLAQPDPPRSVRRWGDPVA